MNERKEGGIIEFFWGGVIKFVGKERMVNERKEGGSRGGKERVSMDNIDFGCIFSFLEIIATSWGWRMDLRAFRLLFFILFVFVGEKERVFFGGVGFCVMGSDWMNNKLKTKSKSKNNFIFFFCFILYNSCFFLEKEKSRRETNQQNNPRQNFEEKRSHKSRTITKKKKKKKEKHTGMWGEEAGNNPKKKKIKSQKKKKKKKENKTKTKTKNKTKKKKKKKNKK